MNWPQSYHTFRGECSDFNLPDFHRPLHPNKHGRECIDTVGAGKKNTTLRFLSEALY